jgi:hypothetical protein
MANYVAYARTNYFTVKDINALKRDLSDYGIEAQSWEEAQRNADFILDDSASNGSIALFSYGSWPMIDEDSVAYRLGIPDDEDPHVSHDSVMSLVADHLTKESVAVFIEVGFEKMRYLVGTAVAINSKGETRVIDLDDIYDLAKELLPKDSMVQITLAHY